ncbi:hypothetical protein MMC11_005989 [Xylographa trunciseda]|nr:hypothetical protein [Xylographa trunciseda]
MEPSLPLLLRAGRNPPIPNPGNDDFEGVSSDSDKEPQESASVVNGIEVVGRRNNRFPTREIVSYRDHGSMQAKSAAWDDFSNKMLPPEETELMLKRLEKRADERQQRTYVEGFATKDVQEAAVVLYIGLTFLPGADKAQVNRIEQADMAGGEPNQKSSNWRVNTAGSLLMQFDVSADLSVVKKDQTAMIASKAKERVNLKESRLSYLPPQRKSVQLHGQEYPYAVTIDSEKVKIVKDLRAGEWDIQCTLIEVDASSLWNLIVNYKHLISRGGPNMSFEETRVLLDTMIEDARRLCVRSPILFRMSTRSRIIQSKNTRYGVDHQHMFQTISTSQGIREIISLGSSYYNSLDPSGSTDDTQKYIRPRFLQMIVLLLSFLNNEDLKEIKDFLEKTYSLRADRAHLELLFLKVIPLLSINSTVFLQSMVPAFEGFPLSEDGSRDDSHDWNVFIQRILQQGYLLPGTVADLGRERLSWIVKWPDNGFRSTVIFNNLQYAGCRLRTINDIPPIELHPEANLKELTVVMTNGSRYTISPNDLDKITCLQPGLYTVWEPGSGGRELDLEVQEFHLNVELEKSIRRMNEIIHEINGRLATPRRHSSVTRRLMKKNVSELSFLNDFKGSGRLTKDLALLNQDTLAMAYKIDGRKIPKKDAIRSMAQDIRELTAFISYLERRMGDIDSKPFSQETAHLKRALEGVKNQNGIADEHRRRIGDDADISDEPIAKVIYPGGVDVKGPQVWNDYRAWFTQNDGLLHVEAKVSQVASLNWVSTEIIEVFLCQDPTKYYVVPIGPCDEGSRGDEIQVGDTTLLLGQYLVVAVGDDDCNEPGLGFIMTNYLKVRMEAYIYLT